MSEQHGRIAAERMIYAFAQSADIEVAAISANFVRDLFALCESKGLGHRMAIIYACAKTIEALAGSAAKEDGDSVEANREAAVGLLGACMNMLPRLALVRTDEVAFSVHARGEKPQ